MITGGSWLQSSRKEKTFLVGGSFFVEKKCEIVVIKLYMQKTGYSRFLVEKHSQYFNS